MRKMACLVLIAFSSRPSPAFAQIDFSTLKVKLGQTVDVTIGGTTRVAPPQFANTSWIELKQAAGTGSFRADPAGSVELDVDGL